MWGTTSPCAKLTGDSGNAFEAASICDLSSFRTLAENQPQCLLGLLQHYRSRADLRRRRFYVRCSPGKQTCPDTTATSVLCQTRSGGYPSNAKKKPPEGG